MRVTVSSSERIGKNLRPIPVVHSMIPGQSIPAAGVAARTLTPSRLACLSFRTPRTTGMGHLGISRLHPPESGPGTSDAQITTSRAVRLARPGGSSERLSGSGKREYAPSGSAGGIRRRGCDCQALLAPLDVLVSMARSPGRCRVRGSADSVGKSGPLLDSIRETPSPVVR